MSTEKMVTVTNLNVKELEDCFLVAVLETEGLEANVPTRYVELAANCVGECIELLCAKNRLLLKREKK